jgi:hypothetical protein
MTNQISIKESIKDVWREKLDYFFLFFQFVVFVGLVRQFLPDMFLLINLLLVILLLILKKRFRVNADLLIISFTYLLICILPILKYGLEIGIYIGFYIRLLTAFFIVMYYKEKLPLYFENLTFILALISLPLFLVQLINPFLFNIFTPLSEAIIPPENLAESSNQLIAHKYLFVYILNGWAPYRNSGFAWEPAAFGGMLCWALLFNLFKYRFEFNRKMLILLIAALTTFSLGTYSCLVVIMALLFIRKSVRYGLYISIGSIIIYFYLISLPIVQQNIETMSEKINKQPVLIEGVKKEELNSTEVSRIAGAYVNLQYFVTWPWGYGLATNVEDAKYLGNSPNGLMTMFVRWGIAGVSILLISAYKLIRYLAISNRLKISAWEMIIACIIFYIPFSGNPFYNRPLGLALILFPLFLNFQNLVKKNENGLSVKKILSK